MKCFRIAGSFHLSPVVGVPTNHKANHQWGHRLRDKSLNSGITKSSNYQIIKSVLITIHLNKLEFFAHHGLHDEEAITGTTFEVSVAISFEPSGKITSIHQTINYADVYNVIERHMTHPVALLEMLAENISEEIYLFDKRIKNINITINKIHPPLNNFIGQVGVTFHKEF